jgi:hypothetical protein
MAQPDGLCKILVCTGQAATTSTQGSRSLTQAHAPPASLMAAQSRWWGVAVPGHPTAMLPRRRRPDAVRYRWQQDQTYRYWRRYLVALVVPITVPIRVTTSRKPRPQIASQPALPLVDTSWRRGESNP